jgi:hypothetical protein
MRGEVLGGNASWGSGTACWAPHLGLIARRPDNTTLFVKTPTEHLIDIDQQREQGGFNSLNSSEEPVEVPL